MFIIMNLWLLLSSLPSDYDDYDDYEIYDESHHFYTDDDVYIDEDEDKHDGNNTEVEDDHLYRIGDKVD